jgi:hypothetical protein
MLLASSSPQFSEKSNPWLSSRPTWSSGGCRACGDTEQEGPLAAALALPAWDPPGVGLTTRFLKLHIAASGCSHKT